MSECGRLINYMHGIRVKGVSSQTLSRVTRGKSVISWVQSMNPNVKSKIENAWLSNLPNFVLKIPSGGLGKGV